MKLLPEVGRGPTKTDLLCVLGLQGEKVRTPRGVEVPALTLGSLAGEFREGRKRD